MRVLLAIDQFVDATNGTSIATRRFAHELVRRGHEVRVACLGPAEPPIAVYPQPEFHLPVFQPLVYAQGASIAGADEASLREALAWCDVAHFCTPFVLGHAGAMLAAEMGVPRTAAFHIQPENLSSSIGLGKCAWFNSILYRAFDWSLYQHVRHVQCPSQMVARLLREHGYRNELHVISNGIEDSFRYRRLPKQDDLRGRIVVIMVGRYSREKRQDVVVRGVARSRHKDQITLVLAGQGPCERSLRRLSERLGVDVRYGFLTQPELHDLLAMTDVYVHASDMETEAMSCMEAFATGLVPVIADAPLSATPQFALDERSLFRAGDPADLARRIDWWIEHPEERERMGRAYALAAERYRIGPCVDLFEAMLEQAIGYAGRPSS